MFPSTTQITEYRTDSKLPISIHRPEYNYLTFWYGAPFISDCRCISHNKSSLHKYVHVYEDIKVQTIRQLMIAECL